MNPRGLNPDGTLARRGGLHRVQGPFAPVVAAARERITQTFGAARLHSAYLYGSIPRGTAVQGRSDLDLLLALHDEPGAADRADARRLEAALDGAFSQIDGVGVLLFGARTLLSDVERHDLGFFVACLCTPLLGDDLGEQLPRYRPNSLLARETNGDLGLAMHRWRSMAADAAGDTDSTALDLLARRAARRTVRTGFTLVMPRWGGWTDDLTEAAAAFCDYYPARAGQMRAVAATASRTNADGSAAAVLDMLLEDLGPWLAAEYEAVHGLKQSRPMQSGTARKPLAPPPSPM
ncbi:nucleotidyltransferase [Streptomyces sp. MUM 178J]|uniref:nucleotidyltransferase n=1 Tax=Streptomyces sp. MUM 178J TaxID=2791991 RepID=UPI001F03E45B|nr:nucleotidyltransferase [Streptomyces sp. MUM 178J]WRQ81323.1 nucleotidyltransferase [Streptomyces sp. MUM 178J]